MAANATTNSRPTLHAEPRKKAALKSVAILEAGVEDAVTLFRLSMAIAREVLSGEITPRVCDAAARAVSAGTKALDVQYRMGKAPMLP